MTKILVIDDEDSFRESAIEILRANGFEAIGANNGAAGLEAARTTFPDLVLCDIRMELVNGYQLLEAIRKDSMIASTPFILMTSNAGIKGMRQGMDLGADDYLPKPFTTTELLNAVTGRLKRHRLVAESAEEKLRELRARMSTMIPHELRTPLNGILGFADIMRKDYKNLQPQDVAKMSERIYRNGKRLLRLVENYLLFAQIGAQTLDKHQKDLLRQSVTEVQETVEELAREKAQENGRLEDLDLHVAPCSVAMSAQYFAKIVEEIGDNAFRYSPKGSSVYFGTVASEDALLVMIIDRGRGMTKEQIESLGAYVQIDRKVYEQQGSGLGLTVAKRLIEMHGGSLSIQSDFGHGTNVTVRLPRVVTPAPTV
ncbi:MAG TPA: hybrid sensor histidine kinase/response regulator [Bacteroidota bacterium]|nr:hybrid sensor histidine kinase/response regulator [Bacteroidota bacterium]